MTWPAIRAFLDGVEVCRLDAPGQVAPRHWVLGVAALQFTAAADGVRARLRVHRTGLDAPLLTPLPETALVHIALSEHRGLTALPALRPPALDGAAARIGLFLDGEAVAEVALEAAALSLDPAPRAFAHVFCRWLRDGEIEPGYDLTPFQSLPTGAKYQRLIHRPLNVGAIVSYAVALRAAPP